MGRQVIYTFTATENYTDANSFNPLSHTAKKGGKEENALLMNINFKASYGTLVLLNK